MFQSFSPRPSSGLQPATMWRAPYAVLRAAHVPAPATIPMLLNNPACFRERANIVQVSSKRRHRSRNVGHGRGAFAFSPLRLRLRSGSSLRGKASGRSRSPTPAPPQWSAISVGVILPGACCPGPGHAFLLPIAGYCRKSSYRARSVGPGSCRVASRSVSPTLPPTHPMNFPLCIVVRCASTARFAARPAGKHNENYPTLVGWFGWRSARGFTLRDRLGRLGSGRYRKGRRCARAPERLRRSSRSVLAPPFTNCNV